MSKIYTSADQLIGHTPLLELTHIEKQEDLKATILAKLDLAGIPFYSKDRDEHWPLIVAGGPCVCNAEPIADFFDMMMLGEGEAWRSPCSW